jgi:hypothetical protein
LICNTECAKIKAPLTSLIYWSPISIALAHFKNFARSFKHRSQLKTGGTQVATTLRPLTGTTTNARYHPPTQTLVSTIWRTPNELTLVPRHISVSQVFTTSSPKQCNFKLSNASLCNTPCKRLVIILRFYVFDSHSTLSLVQNQTTALGFGPLAPVNTR